VSKEDVSSDEMARRFRKCASASIFDILDGMYDMPNQCLDLGIKPLVDTMRVAGPVFTVRGAREPRSMYDLQRDPKFEDWGFFRAMHPGCVVVIDAQSEGPCGHFGEMMSYVSRQFGATGVVIDGGIRDRAGLLAIPDWPVFARYTSPVESNRRWMIDDMQVPINLSGTLTASVRLNPGDWIVGDADGVMVIPQEIAYEVLLKAEDVERREEATRRDLAAGMPVWEVFAKYGRM